MCAAQPVWKGCLQCGHKSCDVSPVSLGSMAVMQMGQASSSAVAGGGWQLACLRCGGVDGAGLVLGSGSLWPFEAGSVLVAWSGAGGVIFSIPSVGRSSVVRSMAEEGRDMGTNQNATQKNQSAKEKVHCMHEKSTAGFLFYSGWPVPTCFFLCFTFCFDFFFCPGET